MMKNKTAGMERELLHWWKLTTDALAIWRVDPADDRLEEFRDETEVVAKCTDWPLLRAHAQRNLDVWEPQRAKAREEKCVLSA